MEYGWKKESESPYVPFASLCSKGIVFGLGGIGLNHHERIKASNPLDDCKGTHVLSVFSSLLADTLRVQGTKRIFDWNQQASVSDLWETNVKWQVFDRLEIIKCHSHFQEAEFCKPQTGAWRRRCAVVKSTKKRKPQRRKGFVRIRDKSVSRVRRLETVAQNYLSTMSRAKHYSRYFYIHDLI